MNRVLLKSLGGVIFAVATLLFILFTASINAPQSMGGPMNMSPSSEEWFYIVLVIDVLLLVSAWAGIRLFELRRQAIGVSGLLVGIVILVLAVRNHIQAPPLDGVNGTNMMPVPTLLHYAGLWLCWDMFGWRSLVNETAYRLGSLVIFVKALTPWASR